MSETLNQQQDVFSTNSNYALFVGKNFKYYSGKWYKFLSKEGLQGMRKQRLGDISFNFWAFFFNSLWCFYRKMYLKGILFMLGIAILGGINPTITLIACLILGVYANKMYFLHVDKKISKILSSNGNNEVARLEIIKAGGTSGFGAFIGLIVMSLFISIALLASNEEFKNAFAETPKNATVPSKESYVPNSIKQQVKIMAEGRIWNAILIIAGANGRLDWKRSGNFYYVYIKRDGKTHYFKFVHNPNTEVLLIDETKINGEVCKKQETIYCLKYMGLI